MIPSVYRDVPNAVLISVALRSYPIAVVPRPMVVNAVAPKIATGKETGAVMTAT